MSKTLPGRRTYLFRVLPWARSFRIILTFFRFRAQKVTITVTSFVLPTLSDSVSIVCIGSGSDTGSRGSGPLNCAKKTGISLTFSQVQLTIRQIAENFERLFFACFKGEFNPPFSGIFGTNWDKSARAMMIVLPTKVSLRLYYGGSNGPPWEYSFHERAVFQN